MGYASEMKIFFMLGAGGHGRSGAEAAKLGVGRAVMAGVVHGPWTVLE